MTSFSRMVLVALSLTFLVVGARIAIADPASDDGEADIIRCMSGKLDACSNAIDAITVAINRRPDDGDVLARRAQLYLVMGLTDKAIDDYNRALSVKSNAIGFTLMYKNLADIYTNKGDYDFAVAYQIKAIQMAPNFGHVSAELYEGLGRIYSKKGDGDRAQAAFAKAIDLKAQNK